jgi:hypothetical protein
MGPPSYTVVDQNVVILRIPVLCWSDWKNHEYLRVARVPAKDSLFDLKSIVCHFPWIGRKPPTVGTTKSRQELTNGDGKIK